ncbi:hypothetical protein AOQ84DRAFT_374888 [Glonium stellatum]|uniref:Uncharacterized protein n=1 Tax=Glonium stellatum TaxID=574774 RepID=A0A8E2F4M8_9PEZI|nr:hypothetical protein AOQ84DRAFT_374888 [Glonium stellatum]
MDDGFNDARAFRVTEIMGDYRNLQYYISQIRVTPSAEEYYLPGYSLLRQCSADAQALLAAPFAATTTSPGGNPELERAQLRSIILDACVRRFQCQKAYLRTHAALRWINSRNSILRGQKAHAGHFAQLQEVDNKLQMELAGITDEHIEYTLRSQDIEEGRWLVEDPTLATIQQILASRR